MKPAFSLGHQAGTGHLPGFLDEHVCPRVSPWGSPLPAAMVSLWSSFSSAFRMCHDDYPPWECGICYSSVPHVLGTVLKLYYWLTLNSAGIHCTSVVGSQNEWEWDKALLLIWEKKKENKSTESLCPKLQKSEYKIMQGTATELYSWILGMGIFLWEKIANLRPVWAA